MKKEKFNLLTKLADKFFKQIVFELIEIYLLNKNKLKLSFLTVKKKLNLKIFLKGIFCGKIPWPELEKN